MDMPIVSIIDIITEKNKSKSKNFLSFFVRIYINLSITDDFLFKKIKLNIFPNFPSMALLFHYKNLYLLSGEFILDFPDCWNILINLSLLD